MVDRREEKEFKRGGEEIKEVAEWKEDESQKRVR